VQQKQARQAHHVLPNKLGLVVVEVHLQQEHAQQKCVASEWSVATVVRETVRQ
jgi:hypothetical protein